jgi:hypothetical protein
MLRGYNAIAPLQNHPTDCTLGGTQDDYGHIPPSTRKLLELDAVRVDGVFTQPPLLVRLVVGEVAFEPFDVAVAFEGRSGHAR